MQIWHIRALQFAVDYSQPRWQNAIDYIRAYLAPDATFQSWSGEGEPLRFRMWVDVTTNKSRVGDRAAEQVDAYIRS